MQPDGAVKERVRAKKQEPKLFKVILLNDDYTTMEFVIQVLESVFDKSPAEAYRIMMAVHLGGQGVLEEHRGVGAGDRLRDQRAAVEARVDDDTTVAVSMGCPEFEPSRIPFLAEGRQSRYTLDVDGVEYDVCAVSMGNPHCVLQVDDVATAPVARLGPRIERHERFPQGANVGFVRVTGRDSIDLRVFERGVGETAACGTGACAAVVTYQQLGLLDTKVVVSLPGGQVVVSWRGGAEPVWLTGNAELVSEGFIDL